MTDDDTVGDGGDIQDVPEKTPADLAREAGTNEEGSARSGEHSDTTSEGTLTPEQIAAAIDDPAVQKALREKVQPDAPNLDALVAAAFASAKEDEVVETVRKEQVATVEEAIQKARDGDTDALAQLAIEDYDQRKQQNTLRPQLQAEANQTLADAIATTYSAEIELLSEDDRKALNRGNFQSDQEHLATVMAKLRTVSVSSLQKELGDKNKDAAEADKNKETAAKAQADGNIGSLPGGKAESGGLQSDDIGELMREGFKDILSSQEYEE